jgi:hypothetical protein
VSRATAAAIWAGTTVLVLAGVACFVLARHTGAGRLPWQPLGIALIASGAVGALVVSIARAFRVESEVAAPPAHDEPR